MTRWLLFAALGVGVACSSMEAVAPDAGSDGGDAPGGRTDGGVLADGAPDTASPDGAAPDGGSVCPAATTFLADRTACDAAPASAPAGLAPSLAAATVGDVVSLDGLSSADAPCLPVHVCAPVGSPTLLFSDSPETPTTDGVLYADTLAAGAYRFYVYHANGGSSARKFPVVVLNQGAADATVTITRRGLAPPSTAYVGVGKAVLADWLTDHAPIVVTVPAGERVLLDPDLDAQHAGPQQLVHAIYDLTTDASLKVSVVSVLAASDATTATAGLSLLPREATHQRGTFANADIVLVPAASVASGTVRRLRLGSDDVDPARAGIDAPTGDAQTLVGNFGVSYRIAFGAESLAISARGGAWAGAIRRGATVTPLPGSTALLSTTTDAIAIGASDLPELTLGTGGGSSLPIDVLFVGR